MPGTSAPDSSPLPAIRSGAEQPLTARERFLRACRCEPLDHPPVWMMRQAGRVLPEYRALKERHTFLELVRTPDLATEVTLQPIRRFGFDAAILFSDILVIPEALGQGYHFLETGGVEMDFRINTAQDVERLEASAVLERLEYVSEALRRIRGELGSERALLGFAGAPWTLANYMIEGGSLRQGGRALEFLREEPAILNALLEKLTRAVAAFLKMQIEAGADAVQIFDSNAGMLDNSNYSDASGRWMQDIIQELKGAAPVIAFAREGRDWKTLNALGANVLSIDHGISMAQAREQVREGIGLQGNLPPEALVTHSPSEAAAAALKIRREMSGRPGHIFNLGHGVPPDGKLENIAAVIDAVRQRL